MVTMEDMFSVIFNPFHPFTSADKMFNILQTQNG